MHQQDLTDQHGKPGAVALKQACRRDTHEDTKHTRRKETQFVQEKTLLSLFRSLRWIDIHIG